MKSYKKKKDKPEEKLGYRTPSAFRASKFSGKTGNSQVKTNPSSTFKSTQHRG